MAYRFGKSFWTDQDRLHLMQVCQEHDKPAARVAALKDIYANSTYPPPSFFTDSTIREELDRLMNLPTPNLRLQSAQFSFSRKIMIKKWAEHFAAEVKKQKAAQSETALVSLRNNQKLMKEVLSGNISSARLDEIVKLMGPIVEKHKNDPNFKRTVGSLEAAMRDRLRTGEAIDVERLVAPATRHEEIQLQDEMKGLFVTPTHPETPADVHFSPMLSLAEAVREAAPIPQPARVPSPVFEPIPPVEDEVPDDFLEPTPSSSAAPVKEAVKEPEPIKKPEVVVKKEEKKIEKKKADEKKKEEKKAEQEEVKKSVVVEEKKEEEKTEEVQEEEEEVDEPMQVDETAEVKEEVEEPEVEKEPETVKPVVPASPEPVSQPAAPQPSAAPKTPQKQKTPQKSSLKVTEKSEETTPLEVKTEEIHEDEEAPSSSMMPTTPCQSPPSSSQAPTPRGRGRPRIHAIGTTPSKKKEPKEVKETPVEPSVAPRSSRRLNDQEPSTSGTSSSRSKKKNLSAAIASQSSSSSSARKRKEGTEEPASSSKCSSVPPLLRSESSFDGTTAPGSPGCAAAFREIEVQTDITIRQIIYETPMGERRRANVPTSSGPVRKGRKSHLSSDAARSGSRNSSASTPAPRGSSTGPVTMRSVGCQTNPRFDIDKEELVIIRVDAQPKIINAIQELGYEKKININEDTCKEIAAENAALGESDMTRRALKVDSKREFNFIVETHDSIGKRLVEDKGYQVVSATCDLPSNNDSPVKRHRRDDRGRDDASNIKYQLLTMHRALYECEWAENFKKPVPSSEVGYDQAIRHKVDLSLIKKEIENGVITTVPGFLLRCYRMFANAIMYNGYDHDVCVQARMILENVLGDITSLIDDERRETSQQRRSRAKDTNRDTSRSGSMEPEPMESLGEVGKTRNVYRKSATNDHTTSTHGSRKSRRSMN